MKLSSSILICSVLLVCLTFAQYPECLPGETSQLAHPNCSLFVVCVNGHGTEMECPEGLYYNPTTLFCDFPQNVPECSGGTRPPITTKVTQRPTEPTSTATPSQPPTSTVTTTQPSTSMITTTQPSTTITTTTVPTTMQPSTAPSTTTQPPPDTLTECGQVINAKAGFIEYKLNENYKVGELCVFFIRLLKAYHCDFTLLSHGIKNFTADTISVIRDVDGAVEADLPTVKLETVGSTVRLNNVHFIVVFKTTTDIGTGFRLQFQGISLASGVRGLTLVFNNQTENPLSFPLMPTVADKDERDTIVITSGAKWLTGPNLELQVLANFSSPGCNAHYRVHSFEGSITKYEGRVCGTGSQADIIKFRTKGLFIVGFKKPASLTQLHLGTLDWYDYSE